MTNFTIDFAIPWLLLLIIPALALTLWPYFRLAKRYRRTRNRIISIILHLAVMIMCISVLSGMTFSYDIPNEENELILVVDMSYSSIEDLESDVNKFARKDSYVRDVIEESDNLYKVGIVAFGYKPVTVAEPSMENETVLEQYFAFRDAEDAALPEEKVIDETASDIAAALEHAASLATNRSTTKLVLVSDCIETDGNALSTVKRLAAEGIKVDVVSFNDNSENTPDFEIVNVDIPRNNYSVGDLVEMTLTVKSSFAGDATVSVYDTDEAEANIDYEYPIFNVVLAEGDNEIKVNYTFSQYGMHRLRFNIAGSADNEYFDTVYQNNEYHSYIYLELFDKILILEGFEGESNSIKSVLLEFGYEEEDVKVVNINPNGGDFQNVPNTMDELRQYDQVILVNVANSDLINSNPLADAPTYNPAEETEYMPVKFDELLNDYVEVYGGGVFMVGGNEPELTDGETVAHSFNRADIGLDRAATLREMLPIDVVEYTPPIAVMIVIDRSGSMGEVVANGNTALDYAKVAAEACLNSLTYRDYMGVMSLENTYSIGTPIVSVQNRNTLLTSISSLDFGGGTQFSPAFERAGEALSAISDKVVSKRHVIVITDGEPLDNAESDDSANGNGWAQIMSAYRASSSNITFSIMHISNKNSDLMRDYFTNNGGGSYIPVTTTDVSNISAIMRAELKENAIQEFNANETFTPSVENLASNVVRNIDIDEIPTLTGYYGTRAKAGSETILMAPYVPLYSQWTFGNGKVGAFMSSLKGDDASNAFLSSGEGRAIIANIVSGLMPASNIRPKDIEVALTEENYTTKVSVATNMQEGQGLRVTVVPLDQLYDPDMVPQVVEFNAADGYSRASVEIKQPGIHRVTVEKYVYDEETESETVLSSATVYRAFSYSKEYEVFINEDDVATFMSKLATSGRGSIVEETAVNEVFNDFEAGIHKTYDPRMLFMILSIIFFLLDIAVRKFKFKWPHEIIRDYKERKKLEN